MGFDMGCRFSCPAPDPVPPRKPFVVTAVTISRNSCQLLSALALGVAEAAIGVLGLHFLLGDLQLFPGSGPG